MPELVLHLLLYLDPTSISRLMQTSRCLKDISTPALYYHVKIDFESTKPKHNIFTSTESILELARNQQEEEEEEEEEEEREEGLLPTIRIFYCAPYKDCPYRLPKFCDPKATLTYICWIMDCNPHLQDVGLYKVLVSDQRDIRLLTTSIFGLKHLQRGVLELNYRDWEESAQSFRWAPIFFGCCPPSVQCFQLELLHSDMYWNWPFDRRQAEPIWQKSDQDCGLLPITTMATNLPLRGQEPLTNLTKLMFLDLIEEIVPEEEFRSMLGQCPNLKHLTMPTVEPIRNPRDLAREIARLCPRLTFINTTHGVGGIGIWETMVWLLEMLPKQLVQGFDCGGDVSFEISGLSQNTDVRSLFWRHSTTLQTIHLGGCRNFDSKAIQAILIGCGGVESLTVHWSIHWSATRDPHQQLCLYLEDAIEVPWACARGLQVLMLTVAIPDQPLRHLTQGQDLFYERPSPLTLSEEETRQFELLEALYRQIGAMSELRTLDLRAIYYDPQGNRGSSADYLLNSFPALLHLNDAAHTETGRPGYLHHLGGLTKLEELMGSMTLTKETT
ncbi:hypothetical protein BGZ97_012557, partial [Linnemannia gamsii]